MKNSIITLILLLSASLTALNLDPIFTDNMVLQREMPVRIYGDSAPGLEVTVTFRDTSRSSRAGSNGEFVVELPAFPAGGPFQLQVSSGKRQIVLDNVMVGEVWLCSGQSNMHWTVAKSTDAANVLKAPANPQLRLCRMPFRSLSAPAALSSIAWQVCQPGTVDDFSAVAYHFGERLQKDLQVPVGLIQASFGGTPAEAWMDKNYLLTNPRWRSAALEFEEDCRNYAAKYQEYLTLITNWKKETTEARKNGLPAPKRPTVRPPRGPETYDAFGGAWNGMIFPLRNLVFRGVIWYQGESNQKRGGDYRYLFADLIGEWRCHFQQPELPFLFVQISTQMKPFAEADKFSSIAELRESQEVVSKTVSGTGMVAAIDLGDPDHDIHPKNKKAVAERLAHLAYFKVYGLTEFEKLASYPALKDYSVNNETVVVELSNAQGLRTADGKEPVNFSIAGQDLRYRWARAAIRDNKLVISSPEVKNPVAVRYAWSHSFLNRPNLYNGAGMPVLPFRTEQTRNPKDPK